MSLAYLGVDQTGTCYLINKYPRKELMEQLGYKSASKMYTEQKGEESKHTGYVIGSHWIKVFRISDWERG